MSAGVRPIRADCSFLSARGLKPSSLLCRYSVSASSSSLSIFHSRPSDSGFYHCRVQVPGLFNDQTFTVHLIILSSRTSTHACSER